MRNHGSIHLFIAGMIAGFLDVHAPSMLAAQAKPLIKVVAGYGSPTAPSRHCGLPRKPNYSKSAASMWCSSAWAPDRCPCGR